MEKEYGTTASDNRDATLYSSDDVPAYVDAMVNKTKDVVVQLCKSLKNSPKYDDSGDESVIDDILDGIGDIHMSDEDKVRNFIQDTLEEAGIS